MVIQLARGRGPWLVGPRTRVHHLSTLCLLFWVILVGPSPFETYLADLPKIPNPSALPVIPVLVPLVHGQAS